MQTLKEFMDDLDRQAETQANEDKTTAVLSAVKNLDNFNDIIANVTGDDSGMSEETAKEIMVAVLKDALGKLEGGDDMGMGDELGGDMGDELGDELGGELGGDELGDELGGDDMEMDIDLSADGEGGDEEGEDVAAEIEPESGEEDEDEDEVTVDAIDIA